MRSKRRLSRFLDGRQMAAPLLAEIGPGGGGLQRELGDVPELQMRGTGVRWGVEQGGRGLREREDGFCEWVRDAGHGRGGVVRHGRVVRRGVRVGRGLGVVRAVRGGRGDGTLRCSSGVHGIGRCMVVCGWVGNR